MIGGLGNHHYSISRFSKKNKLISEIINPNCLKK